MSRILRAGGVLVPAVVAPAIVAAVVALAAPPATEAGLSIRLVGTDGKGETMRGNCELRPLSSPSNTFLGRCELVLGGEPLLISGLDVDGQPVLSAVLDGRITIRGLAQSSSERFEQAARDGAAGFPIYLHVDPFGQAWSLERDLPGGGRTVVVGGPISEGSVGLGMK